MLAWLPSRPTAVSVHFHYRVTSENGQPEVSEEGDRRFQVADSDADVLQLDAHALHATESGRRVQVRKLPVPAQPDKELSRSCATSGRATGTRSPRERVSMAASWAWRSMSRRTSAHIEEGRSGPVVMRDLRINIHASGRDSP